MPAHIYQRDFYLLYLQIILVFLLFSTISCVNNKDESQTINELDQFKFLNDRISANYPETEGKKRFLETTNNRFLFDLEFVLYCSRSSTTKLSAVDVQLNEGVVFSKMPISILMKEGWNFIKILFRPSRK